MAMAFAAPVLNNGVKSPIPARQSRPIEDIAVEMEMNKLRFYDWSHIRIDEKGNVHLSMNERQNKPNDIGQPITHVLFYSRQEIIDFVEVNYESELKQCPEHNSPCVFYQINREKKLAAICGRLNFKYQTQSTPPSDSELEELGFYFSILEVYRSLGSYDSYYGAGKYAGYNLKAKIGLS